MTAYEELDLHLSKVIDGALDLLLVITRHGTGKSQQVKHVLDIRHDATGTAGFSDWKISMLQMMLSNQNLAIVADLLLGRAYVTESDRIRAFEDVWDERRLLRRGGSRRRAVVVSIFRMDLPA